jgi:hypothetical protein
MLELKALGHIKLIVFTCNKNPDFVTCVNRHVPWKHMMRKGIRVMVELKKCLRIWNFMPILGGFGLQSTFFLLQSYFSRAHSSIG